MGEHSPTDLRPETLPLVLSALQLNANARTCSIQILEDMLTQREIAGLPVSRVYSVPDVAPRSIHIILRKLESRVVFPQPL